MTGPAVVIHPEVRKLPTSRSSEALLIEACGLAEAIQLEVIYSEVVKLYAPKANTYLGAGFIELLKKKLVAESIAPIIIVDCTLSPVQQRNLEEILNCKVIDRTALILEIFGARANTHAGRLQVELASLTFQRSRLVRSWTHLERQRGGSGFLGGPGERQIELDRRMLLERVLKIKEELREVERTRDIQRSNRSRTETPTIALVGYTNAGKSTLFNSLTFAKVMAKDMLFATLDPTIRIAAIPSGQKIILADTVGFISELPTELIEAFKSTLEEVTQANFLLHVHDASSQFLEEEEEDVNEILSELGICSDILSKKVIHVLNKSDLISADRREELEHMYPNSAFISAISHKNFENLFELIEDKINHDTAIYTFKLSSVFGDARAYLYENGIVQESSFDETGFESLTVRLSSSNYKRFNSRWPRLAKKKSLKQVQKLFFSE